MRTKNYILAAAGAAILIGVMFGIAAIFAPVEAITPLHTYPTTREVFTDDDYTTNTHTLVHVSFDCLLENLDTTFTNTFTYTLNNDAVPFTLYGGQFRIYTDYPIQRIDVSAGSTTPTYLIECLEQ